jgi:hypothetical protein
MSLDLAEINEEYLKTLPQWQRIAFAIQPFNRNGANEFRSVERWAEFAARLNATEDAELFIEAHKHITEMVNREIELSK